ncbi:MAG: tetratricopeptide (TPR) repeat protein, partial [Planctomycetota bacterium]
MHRSLIQVLCLFALVSPLLGRTSEDPARDFEKQRTAVESLSQDGKWKAARLKLLALLREHKGAEYVRPSLPEIRISLRRAAFWSKFKRPDPSDLISGKLLTHNRGTGKIRVEYNSSNLEDFEQVSNYLLHPLHFRKDYTLEIEASPEALSSMAFMVDSILSDAYLIQPGNNVVGNATYSFHQLIRVTGEGTEILESVKPKERKRKKKGKEKPVILKIKVGASKINVSYDNRSILTVKKNSESLGQFGIVGQPVFEKLTVTGTAQFAWIENVIDHSVQSELSAFETTYEDPEELNSWSAAESTTRITDLKELTEQLQFPDLFTETQAASMQEVMGWINTNRHDEAKSRLEASDVAEFSLATRAFLQMLNCLYADHYDRAIEQTDLLIGLSGETPGYHQIAIMLRFQAERNEAAIEQLKTVIARFPDEFWPHVELAQLLLLESRFEEARQRIDAGLLLEPGNSELAELRIQVAKASQGPSWKRVYDVSGKHTHTFSDLNAKIARVVSRAAEDAYAHYAQVFGKPATDDDLLKLYLFSGQSSYSAYIEGVEDDSAENTAGIYSPRLKQICIWNLASPEELLNVVRHETMHAYMDRALGMNPIWLGEGLAEYFAAAKPEGKKWIAGSPAAEHLALFKQAGLKKVTVEQLLYFDNADFMLNAFYTYPMAWAFVDFLLHSSDANHALFDEIWTLLEGTIAPANATHQVFDKVDLDALARIIHEPRGKTPRIGSCWHFADTCPRRRPCKVVEDA